MGRTIDLIKPDKIETVKQEKNYAKFVIKPLERGYGITIGNALRRVLLSSIPGWAITEVKIEGVPHEFTSMNGVQEDVTDIILNLKGVRFKLNDEDVYYFKLVKQGPGEVVAGDIDVGSAGEVVNPEHHIATLTEDIKFEMEVKVERGRGYVAAEYTKEHEPGIILVDAIFSPIVKVNFNVKPARVGKSSGYDALELEIYTDGTIDPREALHKAAKILVEQFSIFIETERSKEEERKTQEAQLRQLFNMPIEELNLSGRAYNCIKGAGINYVGELVQKTDSELLKLRSFGRKSLDEIIEKLAKLNLRLGMKDINWKPPK